MAKRKKAKAAVPYARRLIEDDYVHKQLRHAATGLRAAYDRARKQGGQATEDKRLYAHVREAATSIRNATIALQRPKPKPKQRLKKAATLSLAIGGCVWLTTKLQKQHSASSQPNGSAAAQTTPPGGDLAKQMSERDQTTTMTPPAA